MALKISRSEPAEIPVPLEGGAVLYVRPAETFEHLQAEYAASELLAGLITGQDAAMRASVALGRQFRDADFTKGPWRMAAAQSLTALELAALCVKRWEGVVDDGGHIIPEPSREYIALLMKNDQIAKRIVLAMREKVNTEIVEGEGLPALPNGGAGQAATAPTVDTSKAPVPQA